MKNIFENKIILVFSLVIVLGLVAAFTDLREAEIVETNPDNLNQEFSLAKKRAIDLNIVVQGVEEKHNLTFKKGLLVKHELIVPTFPIVGLISYYELDDTLDTHSNNDLTNTGVTMGQKGLFGNSAEFTKSSMDKLTKLNFSNNFQSINMWVHLNSLSNFDTLSAFFKDGVDDTVIYYANGLAASNWNLGAGESKWSQTTPLIGSTPYLGKWTMITSTDNGIMMRLYLDGLQVATAPSITNTYEPVNFRLGNHANLNRAPDGKIDEVGIWNRALSPTEISDLYNSGNGLIYPN